MNQNIRQMIEHYKPLKISEQTKVREILQQAALLGLERQGFFEKAAFYGGTALRILYGLDRFSEDLDFTLLTPNPKFDFKPFLEGLKKELSSLGFEMEISQKMKTIETPILSAFMKMNTLELLLTIGEETKQKQKKQINPKEKIQIKLEIDTNPPLGFRVENKLVLNPTSFYVLTLHKSDLFAGKMHAILFRTWKNRVKGRDWYDLIWYIQKKIPLNLRYLESALKQSDQFPLSENFNKEILVEMLRSKIQTIDWEAAKLDMRPFISDPERLAIWSPNFFTDLLEHLAIEN